MTIYGKVLILELVGVGQRYTPVISPVETNISKSDIHPRLTILQPACTKINYIISAQHEEDLVITLKPYLPYLNYNGYSHDKAKSIADDLFEQLTLRLRIIECPWGFKEQTNGSCECQLSNHNLQCEMNKYTILRRGQQWVGATYVPL